MVHPNANNIKIAEIDIKVIDLRKKLRDLKRQIQAIDLQSLEESIPPMGIPRAGYVSANELREDLQLVEDEIIAQNNYRNALSPISKAKAAQPKLKKHEIVKNECEKIRKKKGYTPGTHIEALLDEVAEQLNMKDDAVKRAYYYKPKK